MSAKMRHCFYCGAALGAYADYDPLDTCGKQECERAARDEIRRSEQEARERAAEDKYDRYR